jgi:hypothetical protein
MSAPEKLFVGSMLAQRIWGVRRDVSGLAQGTG